MTDAPKPSAKPETTTGKTSLDSLIEANRDRSKFSGHGAALGAAGETQASDDPDNSEYLREPGQAIAVSPGPNGFKSIKIGVSWDNAKLKDANLAEVLVKKVAGVGIDLDLGCLYEMADGTRGAIQAFGEKFGALDKPPYMQLSGDERTGDKPGLDEVITVNGAHWKDIKKIIVYLYVYGDTIEWAAINPKVLVDVPGENDLHVTLASHNNAHAVCAIAGLDNVRNGIKLTNHTEYFPGHEEMDRAFGFGLQWDDGVRKK